jgi:putative endonuclease
MPEGIALFCGKVTGSTPVFSTGIPQQRDFFMYYIYIIYSLKIDRYYIGQSDDIIKRVKEHCIRKNLGADDWLLKYSEKFNTRGEAMKREIEIKKKKRRTYIELLISSAG